MRYRSLRITYGIFLLCTLLPYDVDAAKSELTREAYERWNSLLFPVLSNDGDWVAYTLTRYSGDAELVMQSTRNETNFRVKRGYIPRSAFGGINWQKDLRHTVFTPDSRIVLFTISPSFDQISSSKETPHGWSTADGDKYLQALGVMHLRDGSVERLENVASFAVTERNTPFLAYLIRPDRTDSKRGETPESVSGTLILLDLTDRTEVRISDVTEYQFDNNSEYLMYAVSSTQHDRDGVFVRRLRDGFVAASATGPGRYASITFDERGNQLAFLSDRDEKLQKNPRYAVYYAQSPLSPATRVVSPGALTSGFVISAERTVRINHFEQGPLFFKEPAVKFTPSGNALIFNITQAASLEDNPPDDVIDYELWHWQEPSALPQGRRPKKRRYLSMYHLDDRVFVQLGNAAIPEVLVTNDGRHAVGISDVPYRLEAKWGRYPLDLYLIDVKTGKPTLIRRRFQPESMPRNDARVVLSPGGRYIMYFENDRWWSLELETRRIVDLTGALLPEVRFDGRGIRGGGAHGTALGVAGWTAGDERVLLYAEHDIWEADPSRSAKLRNVTHGVGKDENIVFRLWEDSALALDPVWEASEYLPHSALFLDRNRPLLLIGLDLDTMGSGVWEQHLSSQAPPIKRLYADRRITPVAKARHTQQYLITQQTFSQYPDLWTGARWDSLRRITDANPQQIEYKWGSGELIKFTTNSGLRLKGRLYKPEGFDSSKKYPMIVSIYEVASQDLHKYISPQPLHVPKSNASWPEIVSRGYLHFVPDIVSTSPYPGQSATDSVVSAIRTLTSYGFVDSSRIGLSGFSFGGYETNYIITQTDIFRCAVSGAGPSNMLSYYSKLPGLLEQGQLRHGGSIWARPFVYLSNSPVIHADAVNTPLFMVHNDGETNVPFSQGLEFVNALQRNGKLAWLINYHGEDHGLTKQANILDLDRRVREFFDHYLKDEPMPLWMQNIPTEGKGIADFITHASDEVSR